MQKDDEPDIDPNTSLQTDPPSIITSRSFRPAPTHTPKSGNDNTFSHQTPPGHSVIGFTEEIPPQILETS